jgi:iron complex outermembrane recepter protein
MSRFKSALLGMTSLTVLATGAAVAQDGGEAPEVITVQGIRQSLQQSIAQKREADGITEVITATDIGRFPDKNVAESLQRLTGITIQREYGEGERVSIRGIASNRNLTQLNGHSVATADWFILDQLSATRSFNYLMLPSEIVASVNVYKSGQANIDEGGVGGTVNVITRRPLDTPSGEFRVNLQGAYSELAESMTPYASGLFSWANEDNTFGVLVAGVYQERDLRRDGIEVLGYSQRAITDQGGAMLEVPDLIGSALFQQTRERVGGNLTVQFRPSHDLDVTFNAFHTSMEANNVNHNYMAWVSQAMGSGVQPTNTVVGASGTLLAGDFAAGTANGVVYDAIVRDARTETSAFDIDVEYQLTDNLSFHGMVGFTQAEGATEAQPFWETNAPTSFSYDMTSGIPEVSFGDIDPTSMADAQSMVLGWASHNIIENFDEEFFAYGDVTREFASGPFENVQAGLRFSRHERDVVVTYGQTRSLLSAAGSTACGGARCTLATVANGATTPGNFLGGLGGNPLDSYLVADAAAIRAVYDQIVYGSDFPDFYHSGPLDSFTVTEEVTSGYVMGEYDTGPVRGNIGVRIVNTDQTVDGFSVGVDPATAGSFDNPFGRTVATPENRSYTDILPSANLVFEINDDMLLRGSASRVMARADYNQLAGAVSLNPTLLSGSGGNSSLDPFRATAFDFGFEWYRSDDSMLAVAVFYKDIGSYITNATFTERQPVSIADPATDTRVLDASNNCASTPSAGDPNLYTCDFAITRPVNGLGGTNQGIEVSYQQPIANGFGVIANYTYSDAESDAGDPIPENSRHAYNLIGYFENEWLNARLSLNHRDQFFIGVDRNRELYHQPITTLDGSVSWYVNQNYALTLEAVNITEETLEQYYVDEGRPARLYDNGRVVFVGVRASF